MTRFSFRPFFCLLLTFACAHACEFPDNADPKDNVEIAKTALLTFQRLNTEGNWHNSKLQEDATREPYNVTSKNWAIKHRDTKRGRAPYLAKQNCQQLFIDRIPLTDTLEDLMTQPAIIECSMAQNVVTAVCGGKMVNDYCAELEVKEKAPVLGTNHAEYDILSPFVCSCDPFSLTGNAALGSFGYISNVDNYFDFHPHGLAAGFNVACVGRNEEGLPLFIGFDPEQKLFSKPRTFAEVQSYLYEQFLQPLDTRYSP